MNGTYLRPRKRRSGARHLAIGAHPLCGQDRGQHWPTTGLWAEWTTASDSPLCTRCLKVLAQLNEEAQA